MSTIAAVALVVALLAGQPPTAAAQATRVRIEAPSGAVLAGDLVNAGRGAPAVLFFHMCRPDAVDGWLPVAERLNAAGITTLRVSPPGLGGSTASKARTPWGPDAAAALAFLRSRVGSEVPVATAGGSCGVTLALAAGMAHAGGWRAVVLLSGPHSAAQLDFIRQTPSLAVFSAASMGEPPSPEWARALKDASTHPASRVRIFDGRIHGTDLFAHEPAFAGEIADWMVQQLKGDAARR
jgi:hypothetical protein